MCVSGCKTVSNCNTHTHTLHSFQTTIQLRWQFYSVCYDQVIQSSGEWRHSTVRQCTHVLSLASYSDHVKVTWSLSMKLVLSCYSIRCFHVKLVQWCKGGSSLVPRPCPAFCHEKWGEHDIFSDVIGKWQKICTINRLCFAYCSTDYMLNTWCVQQSPPLARYVC